MSKIDKKAMVLAVLSTILIMGYIYLMAIQPYLFELTLIIISASCFALMSIGTFYNVFKSKNKSK